MKLIDAISNLFKDIVNNYFLHSIKSKMRVNITKGNIGKAIKIGFLQRSQQIVNIFKKIIATILNKLGHPVDSNNLEGTLTRVPLFWKSVDSNLLRLIFGGNLVHFISDVIGPLKLLFPCTITSRIYHRNSFTIGFDIVNWHIDKTWRLASPTSL